MNNYDHYSREELICLIQEQNEALTEFEQSMQFVSETLVFCALFMGGGTLLYWWFV